MVTRIEHAFAETSASEEKLRRFVADASHELRTPLTSLRTNAELLDRADRLTPEQLGRVSSGIRFEVDELTDLVSELVQLTNDRASTDEPEERVALHELAEHVLDVTRRRTERGITIAHDGDDVVLVRPHMTERAIANLVDNALKYSDGPVEIRVHDRRLEVRDHGPGIPAEDQPKVFDRFFRSTSSRGAPGSGLGLSIVAQIVERHGGSVFATNDPEGGAVVGFALPAPPA
jgi:two-component system sensor histidine kinase MprB